MKPQPEDGNARRAARSSNADGLGQERIDVGDDLGAIRRCVRQQRRECRIDELSMSPASVVRLASGAVMRVWSTKTVELSCWLASLARRTSLARSGRDCGQQRAQVAQQRPASNTLN